MNLKINSIKKIDGIFGNLACLVAKACVKPRRFPDSVYINPRVQQGFGDLSSSEIGGLSSIDDIKYEFSSKVSSEKIKILIIRPGGIGDAVILYPALKMLREYFKNAEIEVLAEKRNAGPLMSCPYINRLFLYDFRPPIELFRTIRRNYDMVIDTEQWHRLSAVFSYLTKAPIRVGFATNERKKLFSHPVSYSQDDYEVYSFFRLISSVTGERYDFNENEPFIPLSSDLISKIEPKVMEFRKGWRALVGMFFGGTIPERRWGVINFAELSRRLSREGLGTVIVGGSSEVKDGGRFEEIVGRDNVLNFVGRTSLMETAAIISKLNLFLSGDTGILHLAYGVGTPTVSLFGAGIQKKWAPIGKHHIVINKNLFCSPCTKFGYTPSCPYEVRCLKEITVDEVRDSALGLLSQCKR
ncbi:MAG TPA: glycosyltransferase family 9 protein [Thermodesulfobacteriota bacterium]